MASSVMWSLPDAYILIQEIEPKVRELGYHTMLGGSVLHKGSSNDDLDLFFCPLNGYERNRENLYNYLKEKFGPLKAIRDSPDYHADSNYWWDEMLRANFNGKKIDIFIR